jgi:hypothetical protein
MPERARIIVIVLLATLSLQARAEVAVSWASDPVRPDETVLLRGTGFGAHPVVSFARLPDGDPLAAGQARPAWTTVQPMPAGDDALSFIVPAATQAGIFLCRVADGDATSPPVVLNRPDVWWLQGDAGAQATPGGWLRLFGKCLAQEAAKDPGQVRVLLGGDRGRAITLPVVAADPWSLHCTVPESAAPGTYPVQVHQGQGGGDGWCQAGSVTIVAPSPWPTTVYNVLAAAGPDAERAMRKSLNKYSQPIDHSPGVAAALAQAKAAGGGIVYFPAGRYHLDGPLQLPPRTLLKGEGMGLVTLWWGGGRFNLDGGGDQGLAREAEAKAPPSLISGPAFGLEALSIYLPLNHQTGIEGDEVHLSHVRIRVDHLWALDRNKRPEGLAVRLGHAFSVTDCDIVAQGVGIQPGEFGVIARNRILAGKAPCPLGNCRGVIMEDNEIVSTFPTAYQNIPGVGQDLYIARNRLTAECTHQADFSFTFDAGPAAYRGLLAHVDGARLVLAGDPTFPAWANEKSALWRRKAVVCVVDGRGSSQWRHVREFSGREWTLDAPFAVAPDGASTVSIVPLCGRTLVIANRFEDANWVNAGYGSALDVIYSRNQLVRCAELLNYGIASPAALLPNFNVQCFDNELSEGLGSIHLNGSARPAEAFRGQITQNTVHRREHLTADNSGDIAVAGAIRGVIIEGCLAEHPFSGIRVDASARSVLVRRCRSANGALRIEGAVQAP